MAIEIFSGMRTNKNIEHLDLSENFIDDVAIDALAELIEDKREFKELKILLDHNKILNFSLIGASLARSIHEKQENKREKEKIDISLLRNGFFVD